MSADDEEEPGEDYFVHLGKKLWRGICSPFRALANWYVRSSAQSQQKAMARKRGLASVRQAGPAAHTVPGHQVPTASRSEDQYTALVILAGLWRFVGFLSLAYGGFALVVFVWWVASTDKSWLSATAAANLLYTGAGALVYSFIAYASAAVIRLMIDVVMTLREIRDK
jgi:hypothetical protein